MQKNNPRQLAILKARVECFQTRQFVDYRPGHTCRSCPWARSRHRQGRGRAGPACGSDAGDHARFQCGSGSRRAAWGYDRQTRAKDGSLRSHCRRSTKWSCSWAKLCRVHACSPLLTSALPPPPARCTPASCHARRLKSLRWDHRAFGGLAQRSCGEGCLERGAIAAEFARVSYRLAASVATGTASCGEGATDHQPRCHPLTIVHRRRAGALPETFFLVDKNQIDYSMTIIVLQCLPAGPTCSRQRKECPMPSKEHEGSRRQSAPLR